MIPEVIRPAARHYKDVTPGRSMAAALGARRPVPLPVRRQPGRTGASHCHCASGGACSCPGRGSGQCGCTGKAKCQSRGGPTTIRTAFAKLPCAGCAVRDRGVSSLAVLNRGEFEVASAAMPVPRQPPPPLVRGRVPLLQGVPSRPVCVRVRLYEFNLSAHQAECTNDCWTRALAFVQARIDPYGPTPWARDTALRGAFTGCILGTTGALVPKRADCPTLILDRTGQEGLFQFFLRGYRFFPGGGLHILPVCIEMADLASLRDVEQGPSWSRRIVPIPAP